jgi:hypothetical protein
MRFNKAIIAALAISMSAAPVMAQSAAPLSVAAVSRSGASMQDANGIDNEYLLPGLAIMLILAAAILWTSNKDSDLGNPVSP